MPKEVKILWNRMTDKTWHEFERQIASYLNQNWTVVGFTTGRDTEYGDSMYVMLQRDTPASAPVNEEPRNEDAG